MEMLYSFGTLTLHDVLLIEPTLFENMEMSSSDRTEKFINQFKAKYNTKSIGAETIPLFKMWIENKFNEILPYYEDLLTTYEKEIDFEDGIKMHREVNDSNINETTNDNSNTTVNTSDDTGKSYDLPNKQSVGYLTKQGELSNYSTHNSIDNRHEQQGFEGNKIEDVKGNVNVIDQREKALKYIRNIYDRMCEEFKDCFALIYA